MCTTVVHIYHSLGRHSGVVGFAMSREIIQIRKVFIWITLLERLFTQNYQDHFIRNKFSNSIPFKNGVLTQIHQQSGHVRLNVDLLYGVL